MPPGRLTCKYNAQLSCGRVQTPTLAMIAKREQEIKEFKPQSYYGLKGQFGGLAFTWQDGESKSRVPLIKNGESALASESNRERRPVITEIQKSRKTDSRPLCCMI